MTSLSPDGGNSVYYILLQKLQLLLPYGDDITPIQRAIEAERLSSFLGSIFSSKAVGEVFIYLLDRKACTAWLLQIHLNIPEATAYRTLKRLRSLGILEKVLKISKPIKTAGGPRPTLWALLGASNADLANVIREHNRSQSPKYRAAEQIVQTMMRDYTSIRVKQEITRREINYVVKEFNMPYRRYDVQLFVEQILKDKGVKVW